MSLEHLVNPLNPGTAEPRNPCEPDNSVVNVVLLVNPAAGRAYDVARIPDLVRLLAPLGAVAPVLTTSLNELTMAARAAAAGGHTIIVAGGDGTVHHVVNA